MPGQNGKITSMRTMPFAYFSMFLSACISSAASASGSCIISNAQTLTYLRRTGAHGQDFELTGQVIIPPHATDLPFTIESGGEFLTFYDRRQTSDGKIRPGDIVRITGKVEPSQRSTSTHFNCYCLSAITNKPLPSIKPITLKHFISGKFIDRRVALRGTIKDILPDDIDSRFAVLALTDGSDIIYVYYANALAQNAVDRSLQDAEVIVSGIGRRKFGVRRFSGPALEISGTNAVQVVRQDHKDPFGIPEVCVSQDGAPGDFRIGLIRKIRGVVIATWNDNSFLLHTDLGFSVQVEAAERILPAVGDSVEAIGHLETDLIDLYLSRAFWRDAPVRLPDFSPRITDITLRQLFTTDSGSSITKASFQGKAFRIRGTIKNMGTDRHGSLVQLLLADEGHSITVDCTAARSAIDSIGEGCRVEVTGVCIKDSDLWRPSVAVPKIRGLFLVVRNAADICVLERPPWWTPGRLMIVLLALLVVIATILFWNVSLRFLVARKSRALLREQVAKLRETLRIGERTHLAAELHDYLAQNLTVVAYQMTAAQSALGDRNDDVANYVHTAARMLKSCRTDLRRCLWDLRSDVLDETDFAKAIEQTVRPIIGKARLSVRFNGNRSDLSDNTAHAILSMLRELAANAVNHGQANTVRIAGECRNQGIRFSISDDGTGFDLGAAPDQNNGHFGLDGIRERLARLSGTLTIESQPERGTYVRLTIPSASDISTSHENH